MFPIRDHNPSGGTPYVNYALIALNILAFVSYLGIQSDERALWGFYAQWAMIPARVSAGEGWYTFLSSMFLHGGWMHLLGNMLFLWIFGDNLEDEMGHGGYLGFYLAGGIGAGLAHYLTAPGSMVPTVGASGAIAAVMGGYLLLFPRAKVDVLFIIVIFFKIIPLPAWLMLGAWFGLQLFNGVGSTAEGGGVAYWAHAGGFVIGLLLTLPLFVKNGGPRYWTRTHGHPPHPEATYRSARTSIPRTGTRTGNRGRGGPWRR